VRDANEMGATDVRDSDDAAGTRDAGNVRATAGSTRNVSAASDVRATANVATAEVATAKVTATAKMAAAKVTATRMSPARMPAARLGCTRDQCPAEREEGQPSPLTHGFTFRHQTPSAPDLSVHFTSFLGVCSGTIGAC